MQAEEQAKTPSAWKALCPVLVLVLIVCTIGGAFMYPPSFHYISKLFLHVYAMGDEGALIFFLAYPISMAVGFPVTVLDITVGFLYSWKLAFPISWAGKAAGCALCYCIAGCMLQTTFQAWAQNHPFLRKLSIVMRRYPWKYCFLLRIIYIPGAVKNYGLAALQVPFIPYFFSSVSITFFNSMWQVTLGREGKTLYQAMNVSLSPQEIGFLIVAGAISLAAIVILVLYTHRVLKNIDDVTELREPHEAPSPQV
jgi:uncharacterized membrane protein YdjX (TVP38/TMEM64 family)